MSIKSFPVLSILLLTLYGCSVYKAAENEGIDVSDIEGCRTKGCFLSHGMEIASAHEEKNGQYVELYRAVARKTGLNYFRAAGHGVLDIATLGLWEVAGTPIEGAISNNRGYITAKVTSACKTSDQVLTVEIYDADGKKIENK